jgi:hypothetical protein
MSQPTLAEIVDSYDAQAAQLQSVQAQRVRDILLVASLYDSYTLSEGEHLSALISGSYHDLSLTASPRITRVPTRGKALQLLADGTFDLVITMSQVADMSVAEFGRRCKSIRRDLPVFLLAYSMEELRAQDGGPIAIPGIDRSFIWRGDVRLFLSIIKLVEDRRSADHDTRVAGVRVVILVEDNVSFYSSYLPMLLTELIKQTDSLIAEQVNVGQRLLRRRLRPKIVLATTYEEAWALYERYRGNVLCIISDVTYPREGEEDPEAGIALLARVRAEDRRTPLLLQSSQSDAFAAARRLGAGFARKHSPTLLKDVRAFMLDRLGFGDFVFRLPDGMEVARAKDVARMLDVLKTVPAAALEYHALRHDFSNWLMARTEFGVATQLRRLQLADFASVEDLRAFLVATLTSIRAQRRRGQVEDFDAGRFGPESTFVRIGGGSLGGKGRGLAFMHELLSRGDLESHFDDVRIVVPPSAVLGTRAFDRFLDQGDLLPFALRCDDDREIARRFLAAPLPPDVSDDLAALLAHVHYPLAARSSSLLEDSQLLPAAGIYPTHMLANAGEGVLARLGDLARAIKHIYASTFFQQAKAYLASTANLAEDEKMAVVLQQIVGRRHGDVLYPDIAGSAASHNFYPVREMRPEDGIASVALGLGKGVVEGERAVRFSPGHPQWLPQFASPDDILDSAQRDFLALDLTRTLDYLEPDPDRNIVRLDLAVAERHGTLWPVASTYSPEDHVVSDGLSRPGVRVVTMAPVLKAGAFPLARVLQTLLDLGSLGMSVPVEIEFAVNLKPATGARPEFALLQVRPLGMRGTGSAVRLGGIDPRHVLVRAARAMGAGRDDTICDIVAVRLDTFDRGATVAIAEEIGQHNLRLAAEGRPYLLIGPGRWGTADRWLGIPVTWLQISAVRAIVECAMSDLDVEPSQGTHFFHNLTSFGIPYFTIGRHSDGHIDWPWLTGRQPVAQTAHVAHYRFEAPLDILVDGRTGEGVILKPALPG